MIFAPGSSQCSAKRASRSGELTFVGRHRDSIAARFNHGAQMILEVFHGTPRIDRTRLRR